MTLQIEQDHNELSIGISECRGNNIITGGSTRDPLGTGFNELGKMAEDIMRRIKSHLACLCVGRDDI